MAVALRLLPSGRGSSKLRVASHSLFLPCSVSVTRLCTRTTQMSKTVCVPLGGGEMAYLFPVAVTTNYYNLGGYKQQKFTLSQF